MNQNKKGSTNSLICNVCKVDFSSNADYALHEFSDKHCDNLIRLAKRKPILNKQKNKNENSLEEKESSKINASTHKRSFAKCGYFIPGEIYTHAETSKEFNTDCHPYLQKFAENPFKEKPVIPTPPEIETFGSVVNFSKKRKKKIKRCPVCNVTLSTVPEYEAHMKSPQHMWKLKITGMGVSAHFVKASTNLHTTDINKESKSNEQTGNGQVPASTAISNENLVSRPFPVLYCNDCELLLNSLHQYNAHINGKFHIDCAQKKAELKAKKEKSENPSPNQLYCYSCKILLNNIFQYNEHKNGKKHKTKCRNLAKKGITIPPEERVPGIPLSNLKKPTVYPELYEKLILKKQKQELKSAYLSTLQDLNIPADFSVSLDHYTEKNSEYSKDQEINSNYPVKSANTLVIQNGSKTTMTTLENCTNSNKVQKVIFHKNDVNPVVNMSALNNSNLMLEVDNSQMNMSNYQIDSQNGSVKLNEKELRSEIRIITDNKPLKCSICCESFQLQAQLDIHLETEDHLNKILELKMNGGSENEILSTIFSDRNVIKPNTMGKLTCSICTVTAEGKIEFDQHLTSIVHKYTLKDYRMKRTLEVKHIVSSNEQGLYFCKLCKEGWPSLLEYTRHLHSLKHKTALRAQKTKVILAKRRTSHLQKKQFKSLKKNKASSRRIKTEKNPVIRAKVYGVAIDLQSDIQAPIPNLEPLEPKIDLTKNLNIGICEKGNDNTALSNNNNNNGDDGDDGDDKLKETKIKKKSEIGRSNRKSQNRGSSQIHNSSYPNSVPHFMPPTNLIPPLVPCSSYQSRFKIQSRFSSSSYVPTNRNWASYSSLHSPGFEPFFGRSTGNPYVRPHRFQRPPWPRHR